MSVVKELFTEKFRPKELGQLIAPPRIKEELNKGLIQNILLFGSAGTGKTSTLKILSKDYTTLFVDASSEGRIDDIRDKIGSFCASISLEGGREKLKCVVLDEMDGASAGFFQALRGVMEKYHNVARFIASCNFITKIPEPIQSRFNLIPFDPISQSEVDYVIEEYKKRTAAILTAAKIEYTPEILHKFVHNDFPDMRAIMNKVQSFYLRGVSKLDDKNYNINYDFIDLFNLCLAGPEKPYENYKLIVGEYAARIDDTLHSLGADLPDFIKSRAPEKLDKLPLIIIAVAEHQAQRAQVIDPLITLLSCVYKIQTILK